MKGFTKISSTFGKTFKGENGSSTRGSGDRWVSLQTERTRAHGSRCGDTQSHTKLQTLMDLCTLTRSCSNMRRQSTIWQICHSSLTPGREPGANTWFPPINWLLALGQSPLCKMGLLMSLTSTMFQHPTITRATWHAHRYGQRLLPELYTQVVLISARVSAALGYGSNDTVAPWKH